MKTPSAIRGILALLIIPAALMLCSRSRADEIVTLRDGTVRRGTIGAWNTGKTAIYLVPADKGKEPEWISVSDIETIQFGGGRERSGKVSGSSFREDGRFAKKQEAGRALRETK